MPILLSGCGQQCAKIVAGAAKLEKIRRYSLIFSHLTHCLRRPRYICCCQCLRRVVSVCWEQVTSPTASVCRDLYQCLTIGKFPRARCRPKFRNPDTILYSRCRGVIELQRNYYCPATIDVRSIDATISIITEGEISALCICWLAIFVSIVGKGLTFNQRGSQFCSERSRRYQNMSHERSSTCRMFGVSAKRHE